MANIDYSKLSDDTLEKLSKNQPLDYSKLNDSELEELSKMPPQTSTSKVVEPSKAPPSVGMLESAARGAGQGLTFGFADELQAGAEHLLNDADYDKRLAQIRDQYKAAAEENPITYHGADILSGFALPIGAFGGFAKGASLASKIGRSAASGAALGALSGAGTSEQSLVDNPTELAKDVAGGAAAGAIAAPLLEGGVAFAGKKLGQAKDKIGAIKDIADFFKYGKQGKELTGPENLRKVTEEGFQSVENKLIPILDEAMSQKNKLFEKGKQEAESASRTVNVKRFEDLINKAEEAGADPKQIQKLRKELDILGKKMETEVTDPAEYQRMYRDKLVEESQKLKDAAYQTQLNNAEKAAQKAFKDAEKQNKDALKILKSELKITNPEAKEQELLELAEKQLQEAGRLKDPEQVAKEARDRVVSDAEMAFKGTEQILEPVTGQELSTASIGPNQRVIEDMAGKEASAKVPDLSGRAAKQIEKLADKNSAYAYALAQRENDKAIQKLANLQAERNYTVSKEDLIKELKNRGEWIDPSQAAKQAKEGTRLSQEPIDVEKYFSPQIGKDVLTAKAGDDELLTKILPQFKFTKPEYQNPELGVRDVEAFRNYLSNMVNKDQQIDFRSLNQLRQTHGEVKKTYNDMLGEENAKAALQTDKDVRKSLAELGVDSLATDTGIENKVGMRDKLAKLIATANTAKGANEAVKVENAFKGLKDIYKNDPQKVKEIDAAFNSVKDTMRQAYLSDITTGHNTFAIDPKSINWTMTASGKLGFLANEGGLLINKIANSNTGKLLSQAKKFAEQGHKKYSAAFEKMSSTEDINKRRAILYTLLQDPGFREAFSKDLLPDSESTP